MLINAILIDDERKALAILRSKLERLCPEVNIIAETQDPQEALLLIQDLNPDLVFLDIAMPQMSGFDLLSKISSPAFEVIFVTAFDNYAIEAIRHCAIGYIVKPVDNEDLVEAITNATQNISDKSALAKNQILIENLGISSFQKKKIVIPTQKGFEVVEIKDIAYCKGVDGYTEINFLDKSTLLSSNRIGTFFKLLEDREFYLIHRSFLINTHHMKSYLNEGYVIMNQGDTLPVSRNRRQSFIDSFKQ